MNSYSTKLVNVYVQYANGSKTVLWLKHAYSVQFHKWKYGNLAITGGVPQTYAEFGHVTLLFCKGRQRNEQ